MSDKAFEALKTYDWGTDYAVLKPIDEAIVASYGDDAARKDLETKLVAVLGTDVTYDAKQYVCRKLRVIGTPAAVPALAGLLTDEKLSHMARYALERMPCDEAGKALLEALPKVKGDLKIGMMSSLASRGCDSAVEPIAALLSDSDASIANGAADALGAIRSAAAAKALGAAKATDATKAGIADASMACAEKLLADGKKAEAKMIYMKIIASKPAKHIKLAATKGMLACAK